MTIILFDTPFSRQSLYPFTLTRPVADIRHGILTIKEKWEQRTGLQVQALSEDYLQLAVPEGDSFLYIDASVVPAEGLVTSAMSLPINSWLASNDKLIAIRTSQPLAWPISVPEGWEQVLIEPVSTLEFPWQLFQTNDVALRSDFELLTKGRQSETIDASNIVFGKENVFIEEGATVRACIINAEEGPVYIGKGALVMEGTVIRGPVSVGNNAVVKMGAKLYAGTTIGPYCTAGGEIKNSIIMGYSNKAHDGYLGDSVIGEWCNLGAGTTNSNIKNTAGIVKMWSNIEKGLVPVGIKAGLLMGDYSRSAINTTFNTGTVVGTCCNVFINGFPQKHIPSFTWGNENYELEKAIADAGRWMQMKGRQLGEREASLLRYLHQNI